MIRRERSNPAGWSLPAQLAVLSLALLLAACGGGSDGDDPPPDPVTDDQTPLGGVLGFVNAIPDSPAVVFHYAGHNDEPTLADPEGAVELEFARGQTFTTTRGSYEIDVSYRQPSGERAVLAEYRDTEAIEIGLDDEVLLVLVGTLEQPRVIRIDNEEFLFGVPVEDDGSLPEVDPDLQLMHTVVGEAALDFYLTEGGQNLDRSEPVATLEFGEFTPVFSRAPRSDYRLRITPAGDTARVLYDSREFAAQKSTRRLVLAFNHFGPGGAAMQARRIRTATDGFPEEALPGAFRFTNLVADVPSVDVFFGNTSGEPVFANVAFGEQTDYLPLDPEGSSEVAVNVTPAGIDNEFVYQARHLLKSGVASTLVVSGLMADAGNEGNSTIVGTLAADDNRPSSSTLQFRVLHGAASSGDVDVYVLAPGQATADRDPQFADLRLGAVGSARVEPGDRDLVIVDADSGAELVGPERIVLSGGSIYSLVLTDVAGGGAPLLWRLLEDRVLPD